MPEAADRETGHPPSGRQVDVMLVDDNPNNLRVLSGMLEQAGYRVRPALNGELALRSVEHHPTDLILLDIRMPDMDGYEVCRRLKLGRRTRDIPVIFISALQDTQDKLAAFRAGGVDYITKPFQMEEVMARVQTHVRLYRLQAGLEQLVAERTDELRSREARHRDSLLQTIEAISLTIEKRDPYTAGHQRRVAGLALALGRTLGLDPDELEGLRLGALIHDIGKINVPAEILTRPGRLSEVEMALIKPHPQVGHEIIAGIELPWPVADMVLQHHERLDGSGYPFGLKGEAISRQARILAVADVVEAMASHRPYRPALGIDQALDEVRRGRDRLYDPAVVDACVALFEREPDLLAE